MLEAVSGSDGTILPVVVERSTMYEQEQFDKGQIWVISLF